MSDSPDRHHRPLVGGIVINPARPRDDTVESIKNGAGTLTVSLGAVSRECWSRTITF